MLGWLFRLLIGRFHGCGHKWECKERIAAYKNEKSELPTVHKYVLQCDHCGEIKIVNSKG